MVLEEAIGTALTGACTLLRLQLHDILAMKRHYVTNTVAVLPRGEIQTVCD